MPTLTIRTRDIVEQLSVVAVDLYEELVEMRKHNRKLFSAARWMSGQEMDRLFAQEEEDAKESFTANRRRQLANKENTKDNNNQEQQQSNSNDQQAGEDTTTTSTKSPLLNLSQSLQSKMSSSRQETS